MSTTMAVSDATPPAPVASFMAFVVSSPINLRIFEPHQEPSFGACQ